MRILFVAEAASPHAARWINQLMSTGWEVHVFQPSSRSRTVSPEFRCGILYLPFPAIVPVGVMVKRTLPTPKVLPRTKVVDDLLDWGQSLCLVRLMSSLKPDVVHCLGLNVNWYNICLPVLRAYRLLGEKFRSPWLYSSWGTDLAYYARQSAKHRTEVERVLHACDYYVAECERDLGLAREMGFQGVFAGFFPAFGGIAWEDIKGLRQEGPVSSRRTVVLKGRHLNDLVGRAMTGMKAFERCQAELSEYRIAVVQASPSIVSEAAALSTRTGLDIEVLPRLPYDALLRVVGRSRVMLALTVNDGLPSILVEAMSLGAFPIHSDLEPIREWIRDGENGLLVPAEDPKAVADALRRALTDDGLVDRAAEVNARLVRDRLSESAVRPKVIEMYERVARQGRVPR